MPPAKPLKPNRMKQLLIPSAAVLMTIASQGAIITWGTATGITGPDDVSLQGTYFGSWAPNHVDAPNYPVNGVTFHGFSDLQDLNNDLWDGYNGFFGNLTSDPNYNALLTWGRYAGSGTHTFSWGGMTPGHEYLVQIWVADARNLGGDTRQQTLSGSSEDVSPTISFPADGSGIGEYIIGTFIADASGTQTIMIDPFTSSDPDGGSAQINLVQVRLIAIPEPTSIGLAGLGLLGALCRRRMR